MAFVTEGAVPPAGVKVASTVRLVRPLCSRRRLPARVRRISILARPGDENFSCPLAMSVCDLPWSSFRYQEMRRTPAVRAEAGDQQGDGHQDCGTDKMHPGRWSSISS